MSKTKKAKIILGIDKITDRTTSSPANNACVTILFERVSLSCFTHATYHELPVYKKTRLKIQFIRSVYKLKHTFGKRSRGFNNILRKQLNKH